jgi:hypothetical protein
MIFGDHLTTNLSCPNDIITCNLVCEKYPRAENCSWVGEGEELKLHYDFQLRFLHKKT